MKAYAADASLVSSIREEKLKTARDLFALHPSGRLRRDGRRIVRKALRAPDVPREMRERRKAFVERLLERFGEERLRGPRSLQTVGDVMGFMREAREALPEKDPLRREFEEFVDPLLNFFEDSGRFMRYRAPLLDRDGFRWVTLQPSGGRPGKVLKRTVRTWGVAALLNPTLQKAFDALDPDSRIRLKKSIPEPDVWHDGRPPGKKDSMPRARRVDGLQTKVEVYAIADEIEERTGESAGSVRRAVERKAVEKGLTPGAVKKRMQRASKKRRLVFVSPKLGN